MGIVIHKSFENILRDGVRTSLDEFLVNMDMWVENNVYYAKIYEHRKKVAHNFKIKRKSNISNDLVSIIDVFCFIYNCDVMLNLNLIAKFNIDYVDSDFILDTKVHKFETDDKTISFTEGYINKDYAVQIIMKKLTDREIKRNEYMKKVEVDADENIR
ncbi:hypothetical protein TPDSL_17800 [Terrisporobacter petrolearius]|uniref:hypothetical protein n=1 Tax=Terrisporobacter petrolearius TaxID=1460447 RepID=UPI0033662A7D